MGRTVGPWIEEGGGEGGEGGRGREGRGRERRGEKEWERRGDREQRGARA